MLTLTKNVNCTLNTAGDGFWSDTAKAVNITTIFISTDYADNGETEFGELCVYFDPDTWDIDKDGLIYTDSLFEQELAVLLKAMGVFGEFEYSEQGMQGEYYVSFDCSSDLIESAKETFEVEVFE